MLLHRLSGVSDTSPESSWGTPQAESDPDEPIEPVEAVEPVEPIDPVEPQPRELPEAPEHPVVDDQLGRVELFGDGDLAWQAVSAKLITARTIVLVAWLLPMLAVSVAAAVLLTRWLWIPAAIIAAFLLWGLWLIRRQVSAMSYIELTEDLVIRKGRVFRQVSSIPYGRLQYVDVQSGPLDRKYGMATLQIFTASPSTSATIPGLPIATAEEMRERLMARGEAQRAGL